MSDERLALAVRTLPRLDANSAAVRLDEKAREPRTSWSPGPGFTLFDALKMAALRPAERPVFVSRAVL